MSGIKYFFDTNAIIALLDKLLVEADWIATSVINVIEFLSFPNSSITDKEIFYAFIKRITVIPLSDKDKALFEIIAQIRTSPLKLPDAIIAGTAIYNNAVLITNDKAFSKIPSLKITAF